MIDDNELEIEAMDCFKRGDEERAHELQDRFLERVRQSGKDHCTCTAACKHHGDCIACVIIHRGHGEHLPACFHPMMNRRMDILSEITEHSFKKQRV